MSPPSTLPPGADRVEQASAWCLRLAEGSLSPEVRARFDAWLAADPANARAFDDVACTWQSLEQTHQSPALIAMRRSALDAFRRGHAAQWSRGASRSRRTLAAVAAVLALLAIGTGAWLRLVPSAYQTGLGERQVVVLADGSRLSLDAQSRVDVRYTGDRRVLRLRRGRAKFQVARDPLRPFSVGVADKTVVATGTEFSVELLATQVHVILYEGSVEVLGGERGGALRPVSLTPEPETPAGAAAGALTPGTELVAGIAADRALVKAADPVRSLAWEAGQLAFNDEPLSSAVERMNRYAEVPLAIGDPGAGRIRVSGAFVAGDTAAFVEGVTGIFPVRVIESDGRLTFVSAR
ncbi:FecR domain-containing protein [Luteimonas sp. SJ-92]|uniref:FecR domain-containing protein n=1 Tax=Luteimonas salinisoli TaxID=2752307 RepID=A0A853JF46_9GAMM|nr:FecR domain-containing protein [Luteimonas salinisoli]NZA27170.1 FecR domain-containing protein [Luteimonas salinisoli]